jgi:hypothetical protein
LRCYIAPHSERPNQSYPLFAAISLLLYRIVQHHSTRDLGGLKVAQTNLTDVSVRSLKPPLKGQKIYFDSALPGFGIRVSYAGAKSWIVVVGTQRRYITLARYPAVTQLPAL